MKARLALIALLLQQSLVGAAGPELPPGWRQPTEPELADGWRAGCENRCAWTAADFNADGLADGAFIAIDDVRHRGGLLVGLNTPSGRQDWHMLDEFELSSLSVMGLRVQTTGPVAVLCVQDTANCGKDGKAAVQLRQPALSYFKHEATESVFVWQPSDQSFRRLWLSE